MKSINNLILLFLFIALASYNIFVSANQPYNNWDMIMYIAAAKSYEGQNTAELQTFTYKAVRNSLSEQEYENLTHGKYRGEIYSDSSAFKEQLPFYQIRPLYTGTIYLLYKAGINIVFATHIISGAAVAAALILLYFLSISLLKNPVTYFVPLLAVIFSVLDLAKYSTPDGMAFLAIIFIAYLYLKQHIMSLLILLPFILGIRTDLILFSIPLLVFIFMFQKTFRKKAAVSILISIMLYIAIATYWRNPGWSTIFYFTLIQRQAHPLSIPVTLTWHQYLFVFFNGIKELAANKRFLLFIIFSGYSLFLILHYNKTKVLVYISNSQPALLSIVCLIFVSTHFLLFPVIWIRFFSGPYLISAFALLLMLTEYLKKSEPIQQSGKEDNYPV